MSCVALSFLQAICKGEKRRKGSSTPRFLPRFPYSTSALTRDVCCLCFLAGTSNQQLYLKKNLGRTVAARCIYDGGNIWTNFACTDLNGGSSCTGQNNANAGNTCKDFGYEITPFRSKHHYIELTSRWGRSDAFFFIANVYRTANGCGGCTGCPMRVQNGCGWRTFDNGNWWLRDSTLVVG